MPSLASTSSVSSEGDFVDFNEEEMTGRSLTESELSKLGYFVPGRSYVDNVSSEISVDSNASDLSLFMAEVNRGVENFPQQDPPSLNEADPVSVHDQFIEAITVSRGSGNCGCDGFFGKL